MAFLVDTQELKPGLIIFRRADVKHRQSYCRIKVPKTDRYKTVSLKTGDIDAARELPFDQDADLRFRIKHEVPIFNRPFSSFSPAYALSRGDNRDPFRRGPGRHHDATQSTPVRPDLEPNQSKAPSRTWETSRLSHAYQASSPSPVRAERRSVVIAGLT